MNQVVNNDNDNEFQTLLESTKAIPWSLNWETKLFTYIGPQIEELLGWPQSSWLNAVDWIDRIHTEDRERTANYCISQSEKGIDHEADYRALKSDGSFVWVRDVVHVIRNNGITTNLVGFIFDITERKKMEEELALAASIYNNSSEGMLISDLENNIISVNPAFETITGYTAQELIGENPRKLSSGKQGPEFYRNMWKALNQDGTWQGEISNRHKDGFEYLAHLRINTIYNVDESVQKHIALITDITDKKRAEETIWHQANFDSLTGLPNRRLFFDRLSQEIKISKRTDLSLALLFIDLDGFKQVNDTLGHDMGDIVLADVANRILACVRESDTVARLAGDEFIVILKGMKDQSRIDSIAHSIIERLQEAFDLETTEMFISASIGIAIYPDDGSDVETLMKNADQAMYEAKKNGKGRCFYYSNVCLE